MACTSARRRTLPGGRNYYGRSRKGSARACMVRGKATTRAPKAPQWCGGTGKRPASPDNEQRGPRIRARAAGKADGRDSDTMSDRRSQAPRPISCKRATRIPSLAGPTPSRQNMLCRSGPTIREPNSGERKKIGHRALQHETDQTAMASTMCPILSLRAQNPKREQENK